MKRLAIAIADDAARWILTRPVVWRVLDAILDAMDRGEREDES